jgi:hypothetical protein
LATKGCVLRAVDTVQADLLVTAVVQDGDRVAIRRHRRRYQQNPELRWQPAEARGLDENDAKDRSRTDSTGDEVKISATASSYKKSEWDGVGLRTVD